MALEKITKIGSNGLDDDVSAGGGGLNSTDAIEKLLFVHHGGFADDTTIGSPNGFVEIMTHTDATIDIESGKTLNIDDNVRNVVTQNISLSGNKKVGYSQIPSALTDDVSFDVNNSFTITVDDGAVLVI